jgi:hypothetical protein
MEKFHMKKILVILALLMGFVSMPAFAKTTPVQTLQDFSVSNPPQTLLVKILSNVRLNKEVMLHEGFYVLGQIQPSSNGGFVFMPVKFQNFHNEVFDINGNYPAKFVEVIEGGNQGNVSKNGKILLDFFIAEEQPDTSIGEKYQDADSSNGVSAIVNQSDMVIYDNSIPQTMKDFPGIKLNSFDNGSNFNIPKKLMIQSEKMDSNINSLKK